jgi:hypothetical protein
MASYAKKSIATLFAGTVLAVGVASPASAQTTKQDGLVNVVVGDITIAENVDVAAVVDVVAQVCAVVPVNITALATQVDNTSRTALVCRQEDGDKVRIVQN